MTPARGRLSRHRLVLIGGSVALGASALLLFQSVATGSPTLIVRGAQADPQTFSLASLQSRQDRAVVQNARQHVYEACMRAKGFSTPPGPDDSDDYVGAYGRASSGDDPSATTGPPARRVEIANGVSVSLRVSWTPQSCMYESFARFGVDPLVREGLRQQMTLLLMEADHAATEDLTTVASKWADCLGLDTVDPQDLLNTIDGHADARSPYGAAAAWCLTDEIKSEAMRVRAQHHLRVAADNEAVVQAWIALADKERSGASAAVK